MKKSLMIIALLMVGNAFGAKQEQIRWCQPDEEKPKQAFDYFVGGDDETCYVQLAKETKEVLNKMLANAKETEPLSDVIRRVGKNVRTEAGKEALKALKEIAKSDDSIPAGVVRDGLAGKAIKKQ